MDRQTLDRVFEPLFTTKKSGTGLGLAFVHQVVAAHEGKVMVDSIPGKGTAFHLLLPLTTREAGLLVSAEPLKPTIPRRVLLVEDEVMIAEGVSSLLQLEGIDVDVVHEGRRVVEAVERQRPDVVVLDVGLPDLDGVKVFEQLDERWPDLPVIFATGHGDNTVLEATLGKPVRVLHKPYEIEKLIRAISEAILEHSQGEAGS